MCFLPYQDINDNYFIQLMWILQYHLACGSHSTFDLFITIVDIYGLSVLLFKQPFNWLASLVFLAMYYSHLAHHAAALRAQHQ